MIHYVCGDILLTKANLIAHGVAPDDHFDKGLALALRERWPSMAKDFRHWCHTHQSKPGSIWAWAGAGGVRIINLLTQESATNAHHGQASQAKLEHVNHALRALHEFVIKEEISSLAIPKIATGVGGLDWKDVKPLIETRLADLSIPVYVYEDYKRGATADEREIETAAS